MSVKIDEVGSTTIEIDIPIEWYNLGKEVCMRYAERIAEAVYLGPMYRASSAIPVSGEVVKVRLSKGIR